MADYVIDVRRIHAADGATLQSTLILKQWGMEETDYRIGAKDSAGTMRWFWPRIGDNIALKDHYLSNDGGDEGISIDDSGNVTLSAVAAASTDTDKFIVSDSGVLKYRTGAQVLSDIGGAAAASISGTENYLAKFAAGGASVENSNIVDAGSYIFIFPTSQYDDTGGLRVSSGLLILNEPAGGFLPATLRICDTSGNSTFQLTASYPGENAAISISSGPLDIVVSGAINLQPSTGVTIGSGAAGVDYTLTFDGETNDGVLTWMEDEDYFKFSDDILMNSTERLYFRDSAISVYSADDGYLDLTADTQVRVNAAALVSGVLSVSVGAVSGVGSFFGTHQFEEIYIGASAGNGESVAVGYDNTNDFGYMQAYGNAPGTCLVIAYATNNVGIGVTDPDAKVEIFVAGTQLKLSFDATDFWTFAVDTNRDMTISGGLSTILKLGDNAAAEKFILQDSDGAVVGSWDSNGSVTAAGRVIVDDATEATSTSDGSIQTDGGLSVVKRIVAGDDIAVLADNKNLELGAGSDMAVYYDGTNGNIDTDLVAPSDLAIDCGAEKTLVLETPVYNDANVGSLALQTGGTLPGLVEILSGAGVATAIYARGFAVGDQGSGTIEIPHDYKEGSDLSFHIHWGSNDAPSGTDNVKWLLQYSVSRNGQTFPGMTPIEIETAYDTQYEYVRSDFAAITGTGIEAGDQFNFSITRSASAGDAFAGEAIALSLGFHYQCDTLGSRTLETK